MQMITNYCNVNKWSPTTVKNICLFENLAKKAIKKVSEVQKIISIC